MENVKVRIKGQLISSKYGTLSDGHILSTDAAYAKFVIDEMKAGEYVDAVKPAEQAGPFVAKGKTGIALEMPPLQAGAEATPDAPHKKTEKTAEVTTEKKVNKHG